MLTYVLLMAAIGASSVAFPKQITAVVKVKRDADHEIFEHSEIQERCLNLRDFWKRNVSSRNRKAAAAEEEVECGKWIAVENECNAPPWMAFIVHTIIKGETSKLTRAFGTLISSKLVLTTSLIFGSAYNKGKKVVYLGETDFTIRKGMRSWNIKSDEPYSGSYQQGGHKMTLVTLATSVVFSAPANVNIRPVCLPKMDFRVVDDLHVIVFYKTFRTPHGQFHESLVLTYGTYEPQSPIKKTENGLENEQPVTLKSHKNACQMLAAERSREIAGGAGAIYHVTEGNYHMLVGVVQEDVSDNGANMLEVNTDKFRKWMSAKSSLFHDFETPIARPAPPITA